MREHTKKHLTDTYNYFPGPFKEKESAHWKELAREAFGDIPGNAINLRGLRNREGLSQKELAEHLGTNQANISKMERGMREISVKMARKLSQVFDIDYRLFL